MSRKPKTEPAPVVVNDAPVYSYFITYAEGNFVGPNRPVTSKVVKGLNTGDIVVQFRTKVGQNIVLISFEKIADSEYDALLPQFGINPIA